MLELATCQRPNETVAVEALAGAKQLAVLQQSCNSPPCHLLVVSQFAPMPARLNAMQVQRMHSMLVNLRACASCASAFMGASMHIFSGGRRPSLALVMCASRAPQSADARQSVHTQLLSA